MFMKIDKLLTELPEPKRPEPNAAAALQELLGQVRRDVDAGELHVPKLRTGPSSVHYNSLVSSIFAEEMVMLELVLDAFAHQQWSGQPEGGCRHLQGADAGREACWCLPGQRRRRDSNQLERPVVERRHGHHDRQLIIDLLHNFYLECGARIQRVYETMTGIPGARSGLPVRPRPRPRPRLRAGLEKLTGVEMEKMLPTPNIDRRAARVRVPRTRPSTAASTLQPRGLRGSHSRSNDEVALPVIPPGPLEVVDGAPEGGKIPGTRRQLRRVCAGLRAGGDLRDRGASSTRSR